MWDSIKDLRAPRTFRHRCDPDSHPNKHSRPSSLPSHTTAHPPQLPSQPGKSSCSVDGSSWEDLLPTPRKAIARISWKLDLTSSGRKTGLPSGPWFVLNAMYFSTSRKSAAEQKQSCTLARSGERGRALAAARNAPPVPVIHKLCKRPKDFIQPTRTLLSLHRPPCRTSSCPKLPS